jgi:hypothetical protein
MRHMSELTVRSNSIWLPEAINSAQTAYAQSGGVLKAALGGRLGQLLRLARLIK